MKHPRIELICIGTELLTNKVNSHTVYLAQKLSEIGLSITREHAVADDVGLMRETFSEAFKRADVVFSAGGLGPTFDDITREVWSTVLKRPLKIQKWIIDEIAQKFRMRGVPMPPKNRRQAMVLKGADVISNPIGTAPGQIIRVNGTIVVLLPGPARELYPMMESAVLPQLRKAYPGRTLVQKTLQCFGVPESRVDETVRPWIAKNRRKRGCDITHGILASQSVISVKYSVAGSLKENVESVADELLPSLRKRLGTIVFGQADDTLEGVVGKLLTTQRRTLAVAESCTGGAISRLITEIPGSSNYFKEGVITYSNSSKSRRLGVNERTLNKFGAVSREAAKEMADGVRKSAGADYGLSVTGIAGPTGGTPEKPVGLVYIGLSSKKSTRVFKFQFIGERGLIRHRAALTALDVLRRAIQ